MNICSYSFVLYVIAIWYGSTVLHCTVEYTANDYCNIRFDMIVRYYTAYDYYNTRFGMIAQYYTA